MCLGMLLYKFLHSLGVIEAQQSSTHSHNSNIPLGGLSYWFSRRFKVAHKCLIGFKFGDCAGLFKIVNSREFSQQRTLWMYVSGHYHVEKSNRQDPNCMHAAYESTLALKFLYICTNPFFPQSYTSYQGHSESCNPTSSLPHLQT